MGSKRIGLARTQALIENLKRELSMGGTTFTNVTQQGTSTSTAGPGAVSGSVTAPVTRVSTLNGEIITTITVDIQNLSASAGATGVVIGNEEGGDDNTDHAYLLTWSDATNGICYKAEMSCLETPAGNGGGTALDIDLKLNSAATLIQGGTATGDTLIATAESWAAGMTKQALDAPIDDTYSLYLVNGATVAATGDAQYSAGKFVIRLYGHADF